MGLLQQGEWVDQWYGTDESGGEFRRQDSRFRSWLTPNGEAGPSGQAGFKAKKGRYHLYVSLACPWAHRTLIFRQLKQLQDYIDVTIVEPIMLVNGWEMQDPLSGLDFLYQLYLKADPSYEGRVTVPVLWDKQTQTIVSNESSEIIRMFNTAFNSLTGNVTDYYPKNLHLQIDRLNERIYDTINNGVYKAGFATTQQAYEKAFHNLFQSLDWVENLLSRQRYLAGHQLTEADWRLFTTLIRFDAVYFGHFKTNRQLLADYPTISGYVRELYQVTGVAETVNFEHIKTHYYASHLMINPTGVIPVGPSQDFSVPHNRVWRIPMRELIQLIPAQPTQDGDGVKIHRLAGQHLYQTLNPFLMIDEINSDNAADYIGGFPEHPHRGFETITYMKAGRMRHRDHMGNEGVIGAGDVQWMTAGAGVLHSEMPEQEQGLMHGFQIWLNLPAVEKMKPAAYQELLNADIPEQQLSGGGLVRVVAGKVIINQQTQRGPLPEISTQPVFIDVMLNANETVELAFNTDNTAMVFVYKGATDLIASRHLGVYSSGNILELKAGPVGAELLVLSGQPINEPLVQYGPFVMNTAKEIERALADFQNPAFLSRLTSNRKT